jgi:hypothetical protein
VVDEQFELFYSTKELKILSLIAFLDEYINNPVGDLTTVILKYSDKEDITINLGE